MNYKVMQNGVGETAVTAESFDIAEDGTLIFYKSANNAYGVRKTAAFRQWLSVREV